MTWELERENGFKMFISSSTSVKDFNLKLKWKELYFICKSHIDRQCCTLHSYVPRRPQLYSTSLESPASYIVAVIYNLDRDVLVISSYSTTVPRFL